MATIHVEFCRKYLALEQNPPDWWPQIAEHQRVYADFFAALSGFVECAWPVLDLHRGVAQSATDMRMDDYDLPGPSTRRRVQKHSEKLAAAAQKMQDCVHAHHALLRSAFLRLRFDDDVVPVWDDRRDDRKDSDMNDKSVRVVC